MIMEIAQNIDSEPYRAKFKGFLKMWKTHKKTGAKELVVNKDNLILIQGANLLALALAGSAGSAISTMYIGFNNNESFTPPVIDIAYSQPFTGLSIPGGFGFLREPLSFPATYLSDPGYNNNIVIFTTMVSSATAFYGNTFTSDTSNIYECALVATPTGNAANDIVFSRVNFNQITYDSNYNLTISWGVKFQV